MWSATRIKNELMIKGTNLSKIAVQNDLCESACRVALMRPFPKAEQAIANELGVDVKEIFSDRYQDGVA